MSPGGLELGLGLGLGSGLGLAWFSPNGARRLLPMLSSAPARPLRTTPISTYHRVSGPYLPPLVVPTLEQPPTYLLWRRLPSFCAPSLSLLARHYIDTVEEVPQGLTLTLTLSPTQPFPLTLTLSPNPNPNPGPNTAEEVQQGLG